MSNHLINETSPYLLQHAENPVDWYPWGKAAFDIAKEQDKPVFLSIGYSTCHWCHVMAHESFENQEVAEFLNKHFVSIKVDKEERPDIDSIYMTVCQAFTGSGGWPTSIFMTPEQKPFFAGTYFPITRRYGTIGFKELLNIIYDAWKSDREKLLKSAEQIVEELKKENIHEGEAGTELINAGVKSYQRLFDAEYGGFGDAPKFPVPYNLIFLLDQYEKNSNKKCLEMAEKTLTQMFRGGLFDHIGYGFCRYSTDRYFLVPHFEKMLYDNAQLIIAYCKCFSVTQNSFYLDIAEKTASYILKEMTAPQGGFYSAQDADSQGEEGKYYVFTPDEIVSVLGEHNGNKFNRSYDITESGNFEGKNIPNLLKNRDFTVNYGTCIQKLYEYRLQRYKLNRDDKILTSWNCFMIVALCHLYRNSRKSEYLEAAVRAEKFIRDNLCEDSLLYANVCKGKRGALGFLDDYGAYIFALLELYGATLEENFLESAVTFYRSAMEDFYDGKMGGFYLYGKTHESLILRPKETYDGAVPSGNSVMAYNMVRLFYLGKIPEEKVKQQLDFMYKEAENHPSGHGMFLKALSDYYQLSCKITVVVKEEEDIKNMPFEVPVDSSVKILYKPEEGYEFKNNRTTYYVCKDNICLPPENV